ncbi:hypothetical protein LIER_37249 [Lithospermum erythrorhizon]|uniref:Transposase n=1 Tax=Lithospermum erythrorhizon TaxID=34254 RepID=A0AAV3PHM2_LITER
MKYPPNLQIWDTRAQSAIYNAAPQSSYDNMVDIATKARLAEETKKRKALEEEIALLKAMQAPNEAAQDVSNKEMREMMLHLQAQLDESLLSDSSSAADPKN